MESIPLIVPQKGDKRRKLVLWPVAVEKLHFSQNSQNLGDTKCLGKRERRL
jgi:hypothetical protein